MKAECRRAVGAKIGWIRIFLFGLHAVDPVVIGVELVIVQFVADYLAEQNENCKSDNKIGEVNCRENLVVPYVSKNVYEKMFDHGFECKFCLFSEIGFGLLF